nr:ribonuclease H-like domain-containing protein [Tanacetum cinerariifolium]
MILEPGDAKRDVNVNETFHEQTDDELSERELKQIKADDQAIQTILLGLPEDIYAAVDSCETAQEIWLRVQQMMKGNDIGIQEKKAKLFNEWERLGHVRGIEYDKEGLLDVLFKLESSLDVLFGPCVAAAKEKRKGIHVQVLFNKMKKIFRRDACKKIRIVWCLFAKRVKWVRVLGMQVTLHDRRVVMQVTLHYEVIVMQVTLHDKRIVMQVTLHYEAIVMQVTLHDKRIVMHSDASYVA